MPTPYRAAAIGRTGRGDYGHDLDLAWMDNPGVTLVAVADENPAGRQAALERTGAARSYADYRDMLARERPDFVSGCPRWVDCHAEMILACAETGVKGVLCEKPFVRTPAEGDAVLEACRRAGTKVAVAHQARVFPQVRQGAQMIRDAELGRVHALVGHGKSDARGGGEDLIVLGTHILDLMRFLAGDPSWVFAHVQQGGHDMGPEDVRKGAEGLGLLAGDSITAVYAFPDGATGTFETRRGQAGAGRRFGLEVIGSEGMLAFRAGEGWAVLHGRDGFCPSAAAQDWHRLPAPGWDQAERKLLWGNQALARDLVAAVEEDREPVSSGADARWAIEMILGVYASQLAGGRVPLPLADREHPLRLLRG